MTMQSLYGTAKYIDSLHVVIVQQNCLHEPCLSCSIEDKNGVYKEGQADLDCYKEFCNSYDAKKSNACETGNVIVLNVNETEGLGPYLARYLGSKFYRGQHYYLQIDSHSEFVNHWDEKLIRMLLRAPADKPTISSYPPSPQEPWMNSRGLRMCNAQFAEYDTIRISSATAWDKRVYSRPRPAPFLAAGFMFTQGNFLYEVPFDPLIPYVFMGEEIAMSARAWTHGYTFFSPTINVLNHYFVRENKPKYWDMINRLVNVPGLHE